MRAFWPAVRWFDIQVSFKANAGAIGRCVL